MKNWRKEFDKTFQELVIQQSSVKEFIENVVEEERKEHISNEFTRTNKLLEMHDKIVKSQCADELVEFIDGERVIGADTKEEQINAQGKNQAYDIVCTYITKWTDKE